MEVPRFLPLNLKSDDQHKPDKINSYKNLLHSFFESCFQVSRNICVWQPSKDKVVHEVTVASNCLVVYMVHKETLQYRQDTPPRSHVERMVCQCLERAQQSVSKYSYKAPTHDKTGSLLQHMRRIVLLIKDPIAHFKSLDILGRVVVLCGLVSLFVMQRSPRERFPENTVAAFEELSQLLSKDVLQEKIPYKNGQFSLTAPEDSDSIEYPCVQDLVSLILVPRLTSPHECSVIFKEWQWLDKIIYCKKLISEGKYLQVMPELEQLMCNSLDPEVKSLTLCIFAECYLKQDSVQLSLQTYKKALAVDRNNHQVFLYIANIYRHLGQADMELETLSLLIKSLTHKHYRQVHPPCDLHLDAFVSAVWKLTPLITLPEALHHSARRSVNLHRYLEASEQYLKLLKLVEESEEGPLKTPLTRGGPKFDVQEVVVETAEALAKAQQRNKCLELFDRFYPILSADDSVFKSTSSSACDTANNQDCNASTHLSQDLVLSSWDPLDPLQSGTGMEVDLLGADLFDGHSNTDSRTTGTISPASVSTVRHKHQMLYSDSCDAGSKTRSKDLPPVTDDDENENNDESSQPVTGVWWHTSLVVRLLLSKADVLIPSDGYSEEVMDALHRAQDLLLNSSMSIFKDSDEESTKSLPTKQDGESGVPESLIYNVSNQWSGAMVMVAERMLQASIELNKDISAQNSAKLLLQLKPDHVLAKKTLRQNSCKFETTKTTLVT